MEPVEAIARWDEQGLVTIREFTWKDTRYPVESTGRSWVDDTGLHVLVMASGGKTFTLTLTKADYRWYVKAATQRLDIV